MLRRMNRRYTAQFYLEILEKLRNINPKTTVTTDVITGFPGETEEEFRETLSLIEKCRFLKVHAFPYSRRSGTVADTMPNQLPQAVKEERCRQVIAASARMEQNILSEFVGKELLVLPEEPKNGGFYGLSENYLPVILEWETPPEHQIYRVTPYRAENGFLYAK